MSKPAPHRITLHLARTKEFPEGSSRRGYVLVAPLDKDGRIDAEAHRANPSAYSVERFWDDEPRMRGRLIHRSGGAGGSTWVLDYDPKSRADDETGYRFGDHRFVVGEYVSIRDPDGDLYPFRVVEADPA